MNLQLAVTFHDAAAILKTPPSTLAYTLYKLPTAAKYHQFDIPKKDGGVRTILAPMGKIREYQRQLSDILYECQAEILERTPRRTLSHGFRKSYSIITNASRHKNRRYVLNLDLADFFPTFNFGRVRGFFLKDRDFQLQEAVATVFAQIACADGKLPQGSPCSPIIADMVAHILDARLAGFAKRHQVTYSRYADDLTFSTNKRDFPEALATGGAAPSEPWELAQPLIREIERAGFEINPTKTRMQLRASRQVVTGLTVNEKVNISQDYWRGARSMCQAAFMKGAYYRPMTTEAAKLKGPEITTTLAPLRGIMSHIYHVKKESKQRPNLSRKDLVFGHKLHEDFWFYDYFVAPDRPIIVTEGPTDSIYLRNAIQRLAAFHPALGSKKPEGFGYAVSFFSYENTAHKILKMTGGIGHLTAFVSSYRGRLSRYGHQPKAFPVILVIDNDSGLTGDFAKAVLGKYGVTISTTTKDPFYHLTDNLYVVKTSELGTNGLSCIEDLFDAKTKALKLDGKTFHTEKKGFDGTKHIGKAPFAKKVITPNAGSIDWAGFAQLLSRIEAVLTAYTPPTTPHVPAPPKKKK